MILKTDWLPNFGESPSYSGWDLDLIRVGASTLILASLEVYSFSVSEIDFDVIIFSGARFLSVSQLGPMCHRCMWYFPKFDSLLTFVSLSPLCLAVRVNRLRLGDSIH